MDESENEEINQEDQHDSMEIENGYISDSNSDQIVEENNSSDEANASLDLTNYRASYDRDIPTIHGYLGKLNPLRGYTIFEDGEILNKIFAIYTTTLVFPGFTLPLVVNDDFENRALRKFIQENNKVFVLLCANSVYNGLYEYGVTMEIFETNLRNNDMVQIKAIGRQRCKRLTGTRIENIAGRIKLATVGILSEPPIVSPLNDTQLLALKSKRMWKLDNFDDIKKCGKYRKIHCAQYPFPHWVYDLNEVSYYTKILLESLISYGKELVPTDPEKLSYWFVQNYQLNHEERLQILGLRSTLERLKLEVIYLRLCRIICCATCEIQITDHTKIFAMSKDGIQSNYVNPGGHVYETVTVLSATNFRLHGHSSTEFSWFPGYSWTIMQCSTCRTHLGWKFSSKTLTPKEFYGLANSGIKVITQNKSTNNLDEDLRIGHISYTDNYLGLQL